MEEWLDETETDPDLLDCITEYAHGQGERTMTKICSGLGQKFIKMAKEQDAIEWRRFMEGMICRSVRKIRDDFHYQEGTKTNPNWWAQGLILKFLKATHGQWIYRNIQIHDAATGTQITLRKEAIQREIEEQMELGEVGLLEEDLWMMGVIWGIWRTLLGGKKNIGYWLLKPQCSQGDRINQRSKQQLETGINFLLIMNSCVVRVGRFLVANLTKDLSP
jgi:hypothetical protein